MFVCLRNKYYFQKMDLTNEFEDFPNFDSPLTNFDSPLNESNFPSGDFLDASWAGHDLKESPSKRGLGPDLTVLGSGLALQHNELLSTPTMKAYGDIANVQNFDIADVCSVPKVEADKYKFAFEAKRTVTYSQKNKKLVIYAIVLKVYRCNRQSTKPTWNFAVYVNNVGIKIIVGGDVLTVEGWCLEEEWQRAEAAFREFEFRIKLLPMKAPPATAVIKARRSVRKQSAVTVDKAESKVWTTHGVFDI
jgi:hypothetical protein